MSAGQISQVLRVRALYKAVLKLHRGLPLEMKALGDQYVKEEFKRHKNVGHAEAKIFMEEWTRYYVILAKQLSKRTKTQEVGVNLTPELVDCFSDEQAEQLLELYKEAKKPLTEEDKDN
ncbi:hypothetical protein FSP39_008786 [Pinctada imbricata]|uniref:Succinate dehydrogenase assembly factor 3 n=1 Tax=Pinctada imbricata TaxID=66713 RepID=A0AA88YFW8_PINIB|nr:hypothetical protein FSP39_008786 [Pinctada imbricata]